MMRNRFWQGMMWGGVIGTMLGAIMLPMMRPQRKPMLERGKDALIDTASDLMHEARKARKRMMHKWD